MMSAEFGRCGPQTSYKIMKILDTLRILRFEFEILILIKILEQGTR